MNGPSDFIHDGAGLIAIERRRQVSQEGWTPEHDDEHDHCELTLAAIAYAYHGAYGRRIDELPGRSWPWNHSRWKPSEDPIRNLVKAGALIAAEIDRLTRANPQRDEAQTGRQGNDA